MFLKQSIPRYSLTKWLGDTCCEKYLVNLEIQVEADAEGVVLAAVEVCLGTNGCLGRNLAIVVESTHITKVDAESLCGIDAHTTTHHVVGQAEREVIHKGVAEAVACSFP